MIASAARRMRSEKLTFLLGDGRGEGIDRNQRINPMQSNSSPDLTGQSFTDRTRLQGLSLRAPVLKSPGAVRWLPPCSVHV